MVKDLNNSLLLGVPKNDNYFGLNLIHKKSEPVISIS